MAPRITAPAAFATVLWFALAGRAAEARTPGLHEAFLDAVRAEAAALIELRAARIPARDLAAIREALRAAVDVVEVAHVARIAVEVADASLALPPDGATGGSGLAAPPLGAPRLARPGSVAHAPRTASSKSPAGFVEHGRGTWLPSPDSN